MNKNRKVKKMLKCPKQKKMIEVEEDGEEK